MSISGGGEALPPLVQEIRSDASQALKEQDKFNASTRQMADKSESEGKRAGHGFSEIAKGVAVGELAVEAFKTAMEGLRKVIDLGIEKVKQDTALQAQLTAGIQSTGNAANVTVGGMEALAKSISLMSGQTDDSIAKTESLLLTFTNIKNQGPDKIFDQATLAAANMAAKFGGDASSSAIQLGKALNDPVKGITALTRVGVSFTQQQKDQIKAMVAANDTLGAQKIILGELDKEFGGSAAAAGQTFAGAIARAKLSLEDLSGSVVSVFTPVLLPAINAAASLLQSLTPKVEAFGEHFKEATSKAAQAFSDFKSGFQKGTDDIGSSQSIFAALGARAFEAFQQIKSVAGPIFEQIGASIKTLAPIFGPLIGQVASLYSSFSPLQLAFKALAPVLPTLIETVAKLGVTIGGALGRALAQILPVVAKVAALLSGELAHIAERLAPVVMKLAVVIGNFLGKAITMVAPLLVKIAEFVGKVLVAAAPLIDVILELVQAFLPLLDPILTLVGQLLGPLIDLISGLLDAVMPLVSGLLEALMPAFKAIVQIIKADVVPIIKGITEVLGGLIDFITGVFSGNWSKAWKGITEIFKGIWDAVKGIVQGAINGIIDLINGAIAGVNTIASGLKDATNGAINIKIGKIPHVSFDVGTNRVPGGTGQPVAATVHGGEVIVSNSALAGRDPIPQRAVDAVHAQDARQASQAVTGQGRVINFNQHNHQHTSTQDAMAAAGWLLRLRGF